jgi:heme/copper-type cytochrome/quinol oxidase subunit 3
MSTATTTPGAPTPATTTPGAPPSHEPAEVVGRRQRLGLVLLIAADATFFLSMMFTWFYLRGLNTEKAWIPAGGRTVSSGLGWLMAGILVAGWLAVRWGEHEIKRGNGGRLVLSSSLTLHLLMVAIGLQIYQLKILPFTVDVGAYASSVFLFSYSALFHIILTGFITLALWNRARIGLFTAENHWHVTLIGYWWLWIAVSGVLTAVTMTFTTSPNVAG